jgi:isoleucyl-tRNA synthetase
VHWRRRRDIEQLTPSYDFHEVVQRLMQFCSVEMGSFYLDIIKDRQYTAKSDSVARRSCQTALYPHLRKRWFAGWRQSCRSLPMKSGASCQANARSTCSLKNGTTVSSVWPIGEGMNDAFWAELLKVRGEVNKVMEQARADKRLGGSLEAAVTLICRHRTGRTDLTVLQGNELRFVLLTSGARCSRWPKLPADAQAAELLKGSENCLLHRRR